MLVIVHAIVVALSSDPAATFGSGPGFDTLVRSGAKIDVLVASGELYRVVAAAFLHADGSHLAINALWSGLFVAVAARMVGAGVALATWLTCGAVGFAASFVVAAGPSVGASGSVYGVAGLIAVVAWRHRERVERGGRTRALAAGLAFMVVLLVAPLGLIGVDHAAHIGGFVAGLGCGWAEGTRARRTIGWSAAALTLAAAVSLVASV